MRGVPKTAATASPMTKQFGETSPVRSMISSSERATHMAPLPGTCWKTAVRLNDNNAGVYGTVVRTGHISVGDPVSLIVEA